MLTTQQIINLAKKQEWWNEFDKKRHLSAETLARHALNTGQYASFLVAAFIFDNRNWYTRAEQFAKLCKEKENENKNSVPEYDLVAPKKLLPDSIQIIRHFL